MGGGVEFSHTGLGIVMECVGFETRVAVLEGHLAIDVEHFVGGIVDAGAAGEDAVTVGGMAPSGVGSGVGVAVERDMSGQERCGAIDKDHGVVPDVHDAGVAIIEEMVAIDGGCIGEEDFDVAEGGEIVLGGIEDGRIGKEDHALVLGTDMVVKDPDIGVVGVARSDARLVLDDFLGRE